MDKKKNIILFGYNTFGKQLYKNLKQAGHMIKVVTHVDDEIEETRSKQIDVIAINIKHNNDLLSLGIDPQKDLLYCVMQKTAHNLFLVLSLRTLYPQAHIISISNSFESSRKLKYAGVNSVIDLYETTARRTVNMLTKPAATRALDEIIYKHNDLKMAEIVLPENCFVEGKKISDIPFKSFGLILIAIIDKELGHRLIFTDHRINHKLDSEDILVVVGTKQNLEKFQQKLLS